jgi:hypothetical protein
MSDWKIMYRGSRVLPLSYIIVHFSFLLKNTRFRHMNRFLTPTSTKILLTNKSFYASQDCRTVTKQGLKAERIPSRALIHFVSAIELMPYWDNPCDEPLTPSKKLTSYVRKDTFEQELPQTRRKWLRRSWAKLASNLILCRVATLHSLPTNLWLFPYAIWNHCCYSCSGS